MIGLLSGLRAAQGVLSVLVLLALLVGCALVGRVLLRRARRPAPSAWMLSALATAAALAVTLWPDTGRAAIGCSVEFSSAAPTDVQSLANLALLVPATFFATIASRRPFAVAAAGAGLSAAVELAQDALPALHRACTTQDWQMNTIGAVLGAAIAWWVARLGGRAVPAAGAERGRGRPGRRPVHSIWTGAAIIVIAGWFVAGAASPIPTDPCAEPPAGGATVLPGGVSIRAGSRTGHLCVAGPDGDRIGLSADPAPGVLKTYGSGPDQWSVGVATRGAVTARDSRGATARTHPVAGSEFRVWSTYRSTSAAASS